MAKSYARYAKEISEGLRYGATWTPGTPLKLGQIGTFDDGVFVPKAHLGALGIPFEMEKDTQPTTYTHVSKSGVSLKFKAAGAPSQPFKSLADAEAGVAVSFSRANAVVFSASKCLEHRIANVLALQERLAQLLNRGSWKEEWAVITHLVEAGAATIIVSASENTTVELEAAASLGSGITKVADISSGVSMSYSDSMHQLIVADSGLTPLFHSLRLKRGLWRRIWGSEPKPVYNKSADASHEAVAPGEEITADSFETVDYDEESLTSQEEDSIPTSQ